MKKDGNEGKGNDAGKDKPATPMKVNKGRKPTQKPPDSAPEKKSPQTKERRAPRISASTFNMLQDAYYEKQSVNHAAKAAKVSFKTAKFYIEGPGRPDLGMVPIKQLWLDVQTEAQERKQLTLIKFQEQVAKDLEEVIETNLAELKLIRAEVLRRVKRYRDSGGKEIETGSSMNSAMKSYERAVRLMERVLGAPDLTMKTEGEDRYRDWTDDEILDFMTTGKVPDHAR